MKGTLWKGLVVPAALLGFLAAGCGEGGKEPSDVSTPTATEEFGNDESGNPRVGAEACINCHEDFSWSQEIVDGYLESKHVVHSTHITAASDAACLECHNPANDGSTLAGFLSVDLVPADGLAAVTCEACHGGGGGHFGAGPMPIPTPGPDSCAGGALGPVGGACHTDLAANEASAGHSTYHPEAMNIVNEFKGSAHWRDGVAGHASTKCTRCHTDEGGRAYVNVTAVDTLSTAIQTPEMGAGSPIQCRTCHDAHSGELLRPQSTSTNRTTGVVTVTASTEYNTCTYCHQSATTDLTASGIVRWVDITPVSATTDGGAVSKTGSTLLLYHAQRWDRVIATTHYDNPATANTIEGLNVRVAGDKSCRDCHNVHSADLTVQTQWAESAHGGFLGQAKESAASAAEEAGNEDTLAQVQAVQQAGPTDVPATAAWTHYDWDHTYAAGDATTPTNKKDRADCQRCHTATGAMNYFNGPSAYTPDMNDFSYLSGWQKHDGADPAKATKASGQNELLYCWACHENNSGALRTPGAITADYNFKGLDGTVAKATFPDVGASDLCIACHAGLSSGQSVNEVTDFTNKSFVNSHYIASAGLMYVKIGYTNFVDPSTVIGTSTYGKSLTSTEDGGALSSTHRKLGTTAINGDSHNPEFFVPGTLDSDGPCFSCHMPDKDGVASHTWEIDGNAFEAVCVKCHDAEGDTPLTKDNFEELFIEEQAVPFHDALALAQAMLDDNFGIEYDPANYPYFFKAGLEHTRANGVTDWTLGGTVDGERLMGACFNINVLAREPAAYIHARTYARRLLYDTIDWLDNEVIDLSVSDTAIAWDSVKYAAGAKATDASTTESMKYLKGYSRSTGDWNAVERP